jgi:hypothetical protein
METVDPNSTYISIPQIYFGPLAQSKLEGFNSVVIELDARLDSDLNWDESKKIAAQHVSKGFQIIWSLNFGLFKQLHLPLSDTSQYRSLNIALDHFFDSILKDFSMSTLGVIIYKGSLDFAHEWPFDTSQVLNFRGWLSEQFHDHQALFNQTGLSIPSLFSADPDLFYKNEYGKNILKFYCMRAALDYFSMLTTRFETDLLPYVLLDASHIQSAVEIFQLLDHEDFEFIQLALKNMPYEPDHALGWDNKAFANGFVGKTLKTHQKPALQTSVGIVIPQKPIFDTARQSHYNQIIQRIQSHQPIKLVSERSITLEWQGLEDLVVIDIEPESIRKLEGFIAAGGRVVKDGKSLDLESEISIEKFLKSMEA